MDKNLVYFITPITSWHISECRQTKKKSINLAITIFKQFSLYLQQSDIWTANCFISEVFKTLYKTAFIWAQKDIFPTNDTLKQILVFGCVRIEISVNTAALSQGMSFIILDIIIFSCAACHFFASVHALTVLLYHMYSISMVGSYGYCYTILAIFSTYKCTFL
jgi:hypothetical protein